MNYLFFSHDGKLGDAIIHTALVSGIKNQDLNSRIDCTASKGTLNFWQRDSRINVVYELDSPSWLQVIKIGWQLRKNRYDYVISWNKPRSEKIRVILKLLNPCKLIISAIDPNKHALWREQNALNQIFHRDIQPKLSLPALRVTNALNPHILLNLFGGVLESKRSINKISAIKLISELRKSIPKSKIILCCEDHTEDVAREISLSLSAKDKSVEVLNLTTPGIYGLIELCRQSSVIISPDTSIVHIASALNKPIIAIYQKGDSKSIIWGPTSDSSKIIISTEPDSIHGFGIPEVIEAIEKMNVDLKLGLT
ncbi:glycosyltransferase family 9 protein [Polynucleobacter corsicus]|uniref:glycosyltransferase family 9 protein n=1 Tax=Polynucleobacter corsicus TaxID=2081042 RepID=UPI001BFE57F8|nr:glycosyltransferase family 9 protein [Polynucleobacter corsicus]QWE18909.1 glycosyltransferase family 9 protein [Polynucleobacter corsicus]